MTSTCVDLIRDINPDIVFDVHKFALIPILNFEHRDLSKDCLLVLRGCTKVITRNHAGNMTGVAKSTNGFDSGGRNASFGR